MSRRSTLARFLFDSTFSSAANARTWRTVVAAGAMIGTAYLAQPAAAQPANKQAGAPAQIMAPPQPEGAVLSLDKTDQTFGTLEAGKKTTVEYTFTNTGTVALKLDKKKVKSSCTCVTATLPKEAVAAGATGVIKLTFVAKKAGDSSTTVTIKYATDAAGKNEASAVLALTGTVTAKPRPRTPPVVKHTGRGFVLS